MKIYYLVNEISINYITSFSNYFESVLRKFYGDNVETKICRKVSDVQLEPGSLIYLIGEPFSPYLRVPGCKYVYLNFSVLFSLGQPWQMDINGFRLMRDKRKKLEAKLSSIDYVLEYYPKQVARVERLTSVPVKSFPVGIRPRTNLPEYKMRKYDVGFVGGGSSRRQKLLEELQGRGFSLSPQNNVILEDVLAESRITLNIHLNKSLHLEIPRILGAFATSSMLVTEESYGMTNTFPEACYISTKYGQLFKAVEAALENHSKSEATATSGHRWLIDSYLPQIEEQWEGILSAIDVRLGFAKRSRGVVR